MMTQNDLIDFIVFHIDCYDCPMFVRCRRDNPKSCRDFITEQFRACDKMTEYAIKHLVEKIRKTKHKLMHTMPLDERRKIQAELSDLRRQLRTVNETRERRQ